jgi:hypothetical protein
MAQSLRRKSRLWWTGALPSALVCFFYATHLEAEDNLLEGLASGPLDGQSLWSASPGMEVRDGTDSGGGKKVIEITDNIPEGLEGNFPVSIPNSGSVTFRSRASALASVKVSSGLFVVLSCNQIMDGTPPDPFFMIGFGPNGNDITWSAPGANTDGSAKDVVSEGAWYQFDVKFDISHQELGNQNKVDFTVTELASGNVVAKESLLFPNQNGPRKTLSSVKLVTGSQHAESVWEVGSLMADPMPQ